MGVSKTDDVYSGQQQCSYCYRAFHISQLVLVAGKQVFCNNGRRGCRERYQHDNSTADLPAGIIQYYLEAPDDQSMFSDSVPDHRSLVSWLRLPWGPTKKVF